jgi:hypothetical protein
MIFTFYILDCVIALTYLLVLADFSSYKFPARDRKVVIPLNALGLSIRTLLLLLFKKCFYYVTQQHMPLFLMVFKTERAVSNTN